MNPLQQRHTHIEKIKLLYLNSLSPAVLSGVASFFVAAALWSLVDQQKLMIWVGITLLLALIRISLIINFKLAAPEGDRVLAWEKPYSITLFSVFLAWGLGLILIIPKDNLTPIFIVNTFAVGLACAAIAWYNPLRYIRVGTISIALLPMIFVLLSLNRPETLWVGIAACCLYVTCLLTSSKLYRSINGNLELAYDLERAIENAEMIANTDMLTGLKNRRAFFDEAVPVFAQAKQHQQMTSVMVMDVDHFKRINDAHGHAVGDVALQHVSHLLTQKLRRSDICCRFGGEEFAVLLADTNAEGAKLTAEKLRTLIMSTPCVIEDKLSISLTASFGVSDKGETLDEMLNLADQAMYQAKNSGRNLVGVYVVPDVQTNSKMTRKKRNERTKKHTSVPAESSETSLPTEISSPPTKH